MYPLLSEDLFRGLSMHTYCQEGLKLLKFSLEFLVVFFQPGRVLLNLLRLTLHFGLAGLQISPNFDQLVIVPTKTGDIKLIIFLKMLDF